MNYEHLCNTASRQMATHSGPGREVLHHPSYTCSICLLNSRIGVWAPIEGQVQDTVQSDVQEIAWRTERSVHFNDDVSGQDYFATIIRTRVMSTERRENETGEGIRSTPRKTCPNVTLPKANPTKTSLRSKPILHGERKIISSDMAGPWNYTTLTIHVAIWHICWRHRLYIKRYNYHKTSNVLYL